MKDIKSLYNAAKSSGKPQDIDAYNECIREYIEHNPYAYISNLEYIISSSTGLATLKEFVDKNGLSVACYDMVMECVESCIAKCESKNIDATAYHEAVTYLSSYKNKYRNCFNMYEFYINDESDSEEFEEKSNGKLKFDFRYGYDLNTGHKVKVVYSLDNINITMGGHGYDVDGTHYNSKANINARSSKDVLSNIQKNIRKKGDLDHASKGQKILAIIDRKTGQRLQKCKLIGIGTQNPMFTAIGAHTNIEINPNYLKDIQQDYKHIPEIHVGDIENVATFKTTHAFKERDLVKHEKDWFGDDKFTDHINSRMHGVETLKYGRGAKVDDTKGYAFGLNPATYNHPSKKDIRRNPELYNKESVAESYIQKYYGFNSKGIQNSKLVHGMVETFGEVAIPDILINADRMGESALSQVCQYFSMNESGTAEFYQNMYDASKDLTQSEAVTNYRSLIESTTLESIVNSSREHNRQILRESAIAGKTDVWFEYSDEDIKAIKELIEYKEFLITCCDTFEEANKIQTEVYDMYQEYADVLNLEEQCADSIAPMLPGASMTEAQWLSNTSDKKTGHIPAYLANNHNMQYGEEDDTPKKHKDNDEDDDTEKTLDDYKRPSANKSKSLSKVDTSSLEDNDDDNDDEEVPNKKRVAAMNNYYYYTYNNSLNKNSHSFNKDNSTDNSVHNKHDDHSSNKRVHSDDINKSEKGEMKQESANPWDLNSSFGTYYSEEVGDADDDKPESDHPIKDALQDIDRKTTKIQQSMKRGVQNAQNATRAALKPVKRTAQWVDKVISDWKDKSETEQKEKLADPHARSNILNAATQAIKIGSLAKAGLLLNPIFLFLAVSKRKNQTRIRNEMIGEIKTEIEILDEKIKDADYNKDLKDKYQLMRFKNELKKKLLRVEGGKQVSKLI